MFSYDQFQPKKLNKFAKAALFILKVRGRKTLKATATESNPENQFTCTSFSTEQRDWLHTPILCVDFNPSCQHGGQQHSSFPSVLAVFRPSALLIRMSKLISFRLIHQQGRDWNCTQQA